MLNFFECTNAELRKAMGANPTLKKNAGIINNCLFSNKDNSPSGR